MSVEVNLTEGPLPPSEPWHVEPAGAVVCFDGVVRPLEDGQPIRGLYYQTYDPMAERQLKQLAEQTLERYGLIAVRVEHSRGFVPNHACSFRLRIAASHRKEALQATDWFIDQMKRHVPIWKRAEQSASPGILRHDSSAGTR